MQDEKKSRKQLLADLHMLNRRVKEQESADVDCDRVKKALLKAESLLRKVFEPGSGMLSVIDEDLRVIYSTWLGSHEDVPKIINDKNPLCQNTHCPGQDRPYDPYAFLEAFKTGRLVVGEKNNTWISHLEAHAFPLFDEAGRVALFVEKVNNVNDREQPFDDMSKSDQRLVLLAETASLLLMSDSPQKVVGSLCHKVLAFMECQAFFNYLIDEESKRLHLNAFGGIPEEETVKMEWLDYGEGVCGCSVRDGRRIVVQNVQETSDNYTALLRPFGIKTYACYPLISKGRILGSLSFCARNRNQFTEDELLLMQVVADLVAITIDRNQSEEKLRRAHDELEMRVGKRKVELAEMVDKLQKEIKERERTELELRQSEERYSLAVDGANDGIWDIDLQKGEAFYSPRWKLMLGYEDDEISSSLEEWQARIHPDDYDLVMETRKAYLEGFIPAYEVKYRLRHKNGSYRWIRARGACLRDSQGKPYRMAGSHTDITERKIMKEALLESEKRYRELFEESKDTAFIVDARGKLVDINPAGSELLGYTKDELLALDLVHDLHVNKHARSQFRKKLVPEGYVKDAEVELRRKDGDAVVVHISASLMYDSEGRLSGYRGIAHDITERRKLEQQLLQAQKMESIGLLAGGVAHEFNNLLTGIYGYGQIIQDIIPSNDELLQESIEQLLRASERAAELTKNLLAFSQKQLIDPKPVHVNTIIYNAFSLIKRIICEDIELSTSFSKKNLLVKLDNEQMEQILSNLATNARDAMPSGGHIHIMTQEAIVQEGCESNYDLAAPGIYALISVSDTGVGIDEKSLERVFEPFYTTKEIGKGTGLGLSIVYGIVKQNNGSIRIDSEPGKGTKVSIYLPTIDKVSTMEGKRQKTKPFVRDTETILVVEDDEIVKTFLTKVLKREGYSVRSAKDGEDAVLIFKENMDEISLVLTDVVMPKKNGKKIFEEIRKIRPAMEVIFITGYSEDIIRKKFKNHKGVDFIAKPFLKIDLLQKVREVFDMPYLSGHIIIVVVSTIT
jgi:two-component system cell cycle sensor histidine kinase/response regulator CckA